MEKNCKHCFQPFIARRKNHVYCSSSCKTLASYQRNQYTYVPGHYQRKNKSPDNKEQLMAPDMLNNRIKALEEKVKVFEAGPKKGINVSDISNAAIGSLAADTTIHGLKTIFAPNTLPATKGDIEKLKNEINELKRLLQHKNNDPWS